MADDVDFDALLQQSSLGTAGARQLRDRTPAARADDVRRIINLRNVLAHSSGAAAENAAIELAALLRSLGGNPEGERAVREGGPPKPVVRPAPAPRYSRRAGTRRLERAGIRDVAAAAGVSITTASDALKGKGRMPDETRNRVREVAERLGYREGESAQLEETNWLTVTQVASLMRVSRMTVYRLVHTSELPATRFGRSFRVPEQAVLEYMRGQNGAGANAASR